MYYDPEKDYCTDATALEVVTRRNLETRRGKRARGFHLVRPCEWSRLRREYDAEDLEHTYGKRTAS